MARKLEGPSVVAVPVGLEKEVGLAYLAPGESLHCGIIFPCPQDFSIYHGQHTLSPELFLPALLYLEAS